MTKSYLIEEDILAIATFGREILQISVLVDSMLLAQLLPKLTTDLRKRDTVSESGSVISNSVFLRVHMIGSDEFEHITSCGAGRLIEVGGVHIPLLPHWPAWIVMISLHF